MENILYLEDGDLNLNNWSLDMNNLKRLIGLNPELLTDITAYSIPVVIFIYGNFCGFCHKMMPEFQKFADAEGIFTSASKSIIPAAILIDGNPREQALGKAIQQKIPGFRGVPTVIKVQNGYMTVYDGERTYQGLLNFIRTW